MGLGPTHAVDSDWPAQLYLVSFNNLQLTACSTSIACSSVISRPITAISCGTKLMLVALAAVLCDVVRSHRGCFSDFDANSRPTNTHTQVNWFYFYAESFCSNGDDYTVIGRVKCAVGRGTGIVWTMCMGSLQFSKLLDSHFGIKVYKLYD